MTFHLDRQIKTGLSAETAVRLYDKYLDELRVVRREQRELHSSMDARLDDIEAELTYLLLRERRPEQVVEIGAAGGWSTTWMLRALRDNGAGSLLSMDLVDHAFWLVPHELAADRWWFRHGDARTLVMDWLARVDHLFIDADHSGRFARWYLAEVVPLLVPGTWVSVHDVFRRSQFFPGREGAVLRRWLGKRGVPHFTASYRFGRDAYERIAQFKRKAGLAEPVHPGKLNPMVFFRSPEW